MFIIDWKKLNWIIWYLYNDKLYNKFEKSRDNIMNFRIYEYNR